jgi:hypothetical protein
MIARFRGRNGSLGYETGKVYGLLYGQFDGVVKIVRVDTLAGFCIYSSRATFNDNWEVLA